ncbi:MAG: valine--tRNA ligase [Actinobacteria bacterium]|nr:valine--tRNA ligase [Actinomycetota bacterium]
MTQDLSTAYNPEAIEPRWYDHWERSGFFAATAGSPKIPYTIVIPPPNVTGVLHIGHAFEHTVQDAYTRRARMMGYEALWLPGTDHAGIGMQVVVDRELASEGIDRRELGREKFVERVWEWKERYGGQILRQMRRLGASCDWSRERFTMDEGLSLAVRTVFVRWFEEGLIYRGNRIINWCPKDTTALSDIEVTHEDIAGEFVTFRYELADGSGSIAVSTTRIETMLGDTGVIVHPDDERYRDVVGKKVVHPFFPGRDMPVVADDAVDPEFGTGAVKATPAHDPLDFEIGRRRGLEFLNVLDERGRLNENAGQWQGQDRYIARRAVLEELQKRGLVDDVRRPYVHSVGHCSRCHTEIEPWLSEQWFVKMEPLAGPAIEAVRTGRIRMEPERFVKSYIAWMENIKDWCISRQLWWGHRIPVWYCEDCGGVFAALEDPLECDKCSSNGIRQDPDVLDTWFSSQLWPFSTFGWPQDSPDLRYFYPTTLMTPGYEILFLWVARMIASGLYFMGDVPFENVFVHGMVRDFQGKKMSKSLGNVVDPLDMVVQYGADALRFSLAFATVPGNDTNVSEERIEGARNFANKLWNASRFVFLSVADERPELPDVEGLRIEDRWILSRLDDAIEAIDRNFATYNVAEAMRALHRFVWSEYCDWYIELSKLRLATDEPSTAQAVLIYVLDRILRLLHPVMPFVTEELWSRLRPDAGSIMHSTWPEPEGRRDYDAEARLERFEELVSALRRLRADNGIPQARKMPVTVVAGAFTPEIEDMRGALVTLARLENLELTDVVPPSQGRAQTITSAGIQVSVHLGDVVDVQAERKRILARLQKVEDDIARIERKLGNEQFTAKAPAEVVEKERAKLADATGAASKLRAQSDAFGPL